MLAIANLSDWINDQKLQFEDTLKKLVEINTFTANHAGVDRGMDVLAQFAQDHQFAVEVVNGRHRIIKSTRGRAAPRILMISHMDTVFPPDGDFHHYKPLENGFVNGPGVGDIKGGLLMGLWSMMAIREMFSDYDVQLVVSADEEIGSPTIRNWYMNGHVGADYAIGLEPGFPQGELTPTVPLGVVMQRRGYALIKFTVIGESCHSGTPQLGLNAVDALAHRIVKLTALNEPERGITLNVGVIHGGTAPNTVPGEAHAEVSFRYLRMSDGEEIKAAAESIIRDRYIYNPEIDRWDDHKLEVAAFIPPMEKSERNDPLVELVLANAKILQQNVVPIVRGGGSDANFISSTGIPTICGMGAPAQGIHTVHEKIHLPLLYQRIELLTRTLANLNQLGK